MSDERHSITLGPWSQNLILRRVVTMLAVSLPLGWRLAIFLAAGIASGISNGIAGGGTFLTFPTLLAMGIPALQANVSTSVGVVPSYVGGIRGFRVQLD